MIYNYSNPKFSDQSSLETEKLERYSNFFQKPPLNYLNINLDSESIIAQLTDNLNEHNYKGNKLADVARGFQQLYETCLKNSKRLESYKETSQYKFEKLETELDDNQIDLQKKETRINELLNDLDELEKKFFESNQEKEQIKRELIEIRKTLKQKTAESEKINTLERKKSLREREEDLRKIDNLKSEINFKDKVIDEQNVTISKLENKISLEKNTIEKLRENISEYKSELFQIKNKYREEKLNKSKYKCMFKHLELTLETQKKYPKAIKNPIDLQNNFPEKILMPSDTNTETIENVENPLISLEEDQSLGYDSNYHSIEIADDFPLNFSHASEKNRENRIFIIPTKATSASDKFTIEFQEGINMCSQSAKPNLSISLSQSLQVAPLLSPSSSRSSQPSSKMTNEKMCYKIPLTTEGSVDTKACLMLETSEVFETNKHFTFNFLSPISRCSFSSPRSIIMNMETWSDSLACTGYCNMSLQTDIRDDVQQEPPDVEEINSKSVVVQDINVREDPVKEYFIKVYCI